MVVYIQKVVAFLKVMQIGMNRSDGRKFARLIQICLHKENKDKNKEKKKKNKRETFGKNKKKWEVKSVQKKKKNKAGKEMGWED